MNRRRLHQLMEQWKRGWSLPQAFYTDAEVFAHDLEQVYYRYWLYAGYAGQLQMPGDFFLYEIGKESIIVIRNKQGKINAFYNVCPHRGSRICLSAAGNHRTLTCPYHQWSFNLEGELLNSRMMGPDFDRTAFGLRRVAVEVLEDLVFVCLAEEPPSFECMHTDVLPQLRPAGMTRAKMIHSETYDVPANWKLITENFRECYHCHVGHPEYIRAVEGIHKSDELRVADSVSRWRQLGFITEGVPFTESSWHHCHRYPFHQGYVTESINGKPVSTLMGDYTEADMGTFCIVTYPNFWFESSSDHAVTMQHTPVSATHTRVVMNWFVDRHAVEGEDYEIDNVIAFWKRTGEQDWKLCADNQAGVNSRAYRPGPYAPSEIELPKFHDWYFSQIMNEVDLKS